MVRPERRVVLAGASPARVSTGAPGSRLQPEGEIRPSQAECQKPWKQRGANQRAATISERNSLVTFSAERCFGRAEPIISRRRQQTTFWTGTNAGPPRGLRRRHVGTEQCGTGETLPGSLVAQKDRVYKAGRLKSRGAGRES